MTIKKTGFWCLLVTLIMIGSIFMTCTTFAATNLAQGKTASTDSYQSANPTANGNDGNTSTRWCAANGNTGHWWKVDLGSSQSITGTEVIWEFARNYKYKVETSTDNASWSLKVDKTSYTGTAQTQTDNFSATARYIRITVTGLVTSPATWASFYEFRVFGTSTTTPTPTRTGTPTPTIRSSGIPTVYICGDSTVQTYSSSYYPQAGWGQFIASYFTTNVKFDNRAIGGRSSRTFITDGRLDSILSVIKPNDYLFVQFGHNDADSSKPERYCAPYTTYKEYLKQYVDRARQYNAIPVLITPVARLHYVNGAFVNDFPDYCTAMKQVAAENNCKIIDLMTKSLNYLTSIGYNEAYTLYMVSSNGTDYTHFTEKGATQMARLVSQGVKEIGVPISQYVK